MGGGLGCPDGKSLAAELFGEGRNEVVWWWGVDVER
jgi:hypothetical protein